MSKSGKHQIIEALEACSLFSGLNKNDLENIADLSEIIHIRKGQLLFSEGETAEAF